ncbi:TPT-domain-containing protein [Tilletiaria anomala UBC 951]|uniref:TPT-domain-containing protein n=1 Tax=Tilletiaria anomala (strain ATCC 24038 / CBS 436.72 / UBC 951) TaxID=1037660 RepID=A0A066WPL9_TILAU|nr:TPT-domain-containing protein [Tilletiaria anomala UBC 951]KDN52570.1 TPT-domain-containing protein [Tilletiaria anomala UBC 951]
MDGGDKSSQASLELRIHTAEQRKREYWRSALANASLILSWYFFSTMISVYNKWMFSTAHYKFSYPLFVTSAHMIIQFIFSGLLLYFCGDRFIARKPNGQRPRPSFRDWASKIAPCALATAVDIGLSNLSLKTITLTFYTMCKSSNLAFVLLFAFLFRLEVIRWRLVGIIALITAGVIMMVAAETKLVLVGAVEVLTASAMGGLRWALTQMLIDREGMGLNHPVATIYWLSPIMACGLVGASLAFENWHKILGGPFFHGVVRSLRTLGLITLPGLLAFCMNLSEFALIRRTSVVTLSVAGIFKEVLTVIVASTIFGDELTPINITGLCITLIGIGLYNWLRFRILTKSSTILQSGARHGGETYGQLPGGEFSERAAFEVDGGEDEVAGGAASSRSHSRAPSIAMSETRMADAELSEAEKERRRKREEEANMAGWATSGEPAMCFSLLCSA